MPTTMTEQVRRLAETTAAQPSNEMMGSFTREQADLANRGRSAVIEVGATLFDAELPTAAGISTAPSDEASAAQLQLGLDLTAVNADGTTGLPRPTTTIVDASRAIGWIDVHPDYTTRSEPGRIPTSASSTSSPSSSQTAAFRTPSTESQGHLLDWRSP